MRHTGEGPEHKLRIASKRDSVDSFQEAEGRERNVHMVTLRL